MCCMRPDAFQHPLIQSINSLVSGKYYTQHHIEHDGIKTKFRAAVRISKKDSLFCSRHVSYHCLVKANQTTNGTSKEETGGYPYFFLQISKIQHIKKSGIKKRNKGKTSSFSLQLRWRHQEEKGNSFKSQCLLVAHRNCSAEDVTTV